MTKEERNAIDHYLNNLLDLVSEENCTENNYSTLLFKVKEELTSINNNEFVSFLVWIHSEKKFKVDNINEYFKGATK